MVDHELNPSFLASVNPDELQLVEKKGRMGTPKQRKKKEREKRAAEKTSPSSSATCSKSFRNVEDIERKPFTKDWDVSMKMTAALPIKRHDGKVVKTMRIEKESYSSEDEDEQEDDMKENEKEENSSVTEEVEENEFYVPDDEQKKEKLKVNIIKNTRSLDEKKIHIANICHSVTTNPMESLRKRRNTESSEDDMFKLADLMSYLKDPDPRAQEVAMLSCLLVFKDICPSYRIRSRDESEKDVTLKKETKRLRDFELALLGSYQSYLKFLSKSVASGLGSTKRDKPLNGENNSLRAAWEVGLSALRCQCELARFLVHFNFRTNLLEAVVERAAQPLESISEICCQTLRDIFASDNDGEVSFETVRIMGKKLTSVKYVVPERFLKTLDCVKLQVHADTARDVRKKAKQNRRKRKRQSDDIDASLQETDANSMAINAKRFQADSLHEICIIYFRVIKMKVGFTLLPVVLENLGKITHLMNIDMVEDMCVLLKEMVQSVPPIPEVVRLQCIHCALKTLSGPGQELSMDDECFVVGLRILLCDLPLQFHHWDVALESVDLCLMKKRDVRSSLVLSFVRLLIDVVPYLHPNSVGLTALTLVHSILLRYPRTRQSLDAISTVVAQRDDEVGDLAMQALRNESLDPESSSEGDGSWALPLIRMHYDSRFSKVLLALTAKSVTPIPLRFQEAHAKDPASFLVGIDSEFEKLKPKHAKDSAHSKCKIDRNVITKKVIKKAKKKKK